MLWIPGVMPKPRRPDLHPHTRETWHPEEPVGHTEVKGKKKGTRRDRRSKKHSRA